MLEELTVLNYALIDRVHVRFSDGLNILTGETGAGKSILVGALGLLLGQKTDASVIRTGSDETVVTGVIRIANNPDATSWLADRSIEPEDGSIIIRRVVKKKGRGACYIQSTPVTLTDLAELATVLFDYHGQHQHQSLLNTENHRRLLDRFGKSEPLADQVADLYSKWSAAAERLTKLTADERERLREIDLLTYAVREIDQAEFSSDEEDRLEAEHKILANHERLFRLVDEVLGLVAESRQGALAALRKSREAMEEIARIDPGLAAANNQLQDAFFELEDFSGTVRSYHSSVQFDPARLAAAESRLSQIRDLERKYGETLVDVLAYRDESARQLESLENWEDEKRELTDQIATLESELRRLSQELSDRRKDAAGGLQDRVAHELKQLSMPKVRFRVVVQERGKDSQEAPPLGATGIDLVEFVISTNLGEPFRRLRQIASGGELSRIMLAIKSVLVDSDHISTLIFDEVDTGVGGQVAISVGDRLQGLSQEKQILCITHLATIAVRADNHLRVEKVVSGQRTSTRVERIIDAARTKEISRMLSGDSTNQAALTHAEELLQRYSS